MCAAISYLRLTNTVIVCLVLCSHAEAAVEPSRSIFLQERNTAVTYDDTGAFSNWRGLIDWRVDGVGQLFEQSFWVDEVFLGETPVVELGDTHARITQDNSHLDVTHRRGGPGAFDVDVSYGLAGQPPGSGLSLLIEDIVVTNRSGISFPGFSFFVYNDFDLNESAGDDRGVVERGGQRITQEDLSSRRFLTADVLVGSEIPDQFQIAAHQNGETSLILRSLEDSNRTSLANIGSGSVGDITWAWQWNFDLNAAGSPGDTHRIRMLYSISVPEPGSLALWGLGMGVLVLVTLRRKSPATVEHAPC